MSMIDKAVEVEVPVSAAYNQWTQFEEFPEFMEGVEEVQQVDDTHLHWRADIGGATREWDARITEQEPDMRIAWVSEEGAFTSGVVTFHKVTDDKTRVMLQMEFNPEDFTEHVGDKLGFVSRRIEGDLKRFKEFIESRGSETGAWRGRVKEN